MHISSCAVSLTALASGSDVPLSSYSFCRWNTHSTMGESKIGWSTNSSPTQIIPYVAWTTVGYTIGKHCVHNGKVQVAVELVAFGQCWDKSPICTSPTHVHSPRPWKAWGKPVKKQDEGNLFLSTPPWGRNIITENENSWCPTCNQLCHAISRAKSNMLKAVSEAFSGCERDKRSWSLKADSRTKDKDGEI